MPGPVVPFPPRHPRPFLIWAFWVWGVGCGVWDQEEFLCLGACYCVTTRLQIAEGMEAERCGSQGAGQLDLGQDLPMVQSRFCGV